jgi:catechol 2,3-dioxygenase-like lactoylglutathione lyase family enzyme
MKKLSILFLVLTSVIMLSANRKEKQGQNVEKFSISLSVADIQASVDFYEKLGFKHVEGVGSIESKWILMQNGKARVGLFQGFFPKNTITMNPKDARVIYNAAEKAGLKTVYKAGMDKTKGPASFSVVDPDGNPVLIDQF